jgi:hypothetical protein
VLGQILIVTMRILFANSVFLMVVFAIGLRSCGFGKVSKNDVFEFTISKGKGCDASSGWLL